MMTSRGRICRVAMSERTELLIIAGVFVLASIGGIFAGRWFAHWLGCP